ncbi:MULTISPECIES: hypothetical protein [Cyanophyceae]|uniref:hypothetical protein n=1 Tax=Cyanophyceae TaxID=3028117 RepID=UPI0016846EC0|nr:hypothetical protein [Trichocoleus sp. FACHB-69]MBD1933309.1 hypothetical protein [Trichocoleus sp. FACHB-69]
MGHAPTLPNNTPTAVVLFAGGDGVVEAGMVMADFRPVLRVECDPSRTELSAALAGVNMAKLSPAAK